MYPISLYKQVGFLTIDWIKVSIVLTVTKVKSDALNLGQSKRELWNR